MDAENLRQIADLKPTIRERVTPEKPTSVLRLRTLADLDGRSRPARVAKKIVADYTRDLGGTLTTGQQQLVRDIALIGVLLDYLTVSRVQGVGIDFEDLGKLFDRRRRMIAMLGLERRARPISEAELHALIDRVEAEGVS